MAKYTKEQVEAAVKSKGYVWFEGAKDYDVNIVGVRNAATGQTVTNVFDDVITVSYKVGGEWQYKEWTNTTDPGKKGVMQFDNPKGVHIKSILIYHHCRTKFKYFITIIKSDNTIL